jgi:predicted phage baseplate assembly protein
MNQDCGCCGQQRSACCGQQQSCGCNTSNPPGLSTINYHNGAYPLTLGRMRARLSSADLPALRALTARSMNESIDPALALLDGWACLSEVLSFYNERLINESYLRTCTERRSALELARLVGYTPRPGVAADVYLAFTLDDQNKESVLDVPLGTRAYSQPGPGETMQAFETSEVLRGRPRWSAMHVRQTAPQQVSSTTHELYFKGITTGLRAGDALLFEFDKQQILHKIAKVEPLPQENRTRVELQIRLDQGKPAQNTSISEQVLGKLIQPARQHIASKANLKLKPREIFSENSYAPLELLKSGYPALRENLGVALGGTTSDLPTGEVRIYAMRVKTAPHGHNAPLKATVERNSVFYSEWKIDEIAISEDEGGPIILARGEERTKLLPLDAVYDQIALDSWVVIERPEPFGEDSKFTQIFAHVNEINTISRIAYQLPSRVTMLTLDQEWLYSKETDIELIRKTTVYAQSELLELADMPITEDVQDADLVLDGYYEGLEPGRRLIVAGERSDLDGVQGVHAAELVMIAAVEHRAEPSTGKVASASYDTMHTYLRLARPALNYRYKRDTVLVYGNVAHATHGESRAETLGSGNAAQPFQSFALRQTPLTYVSAPSISGVQSSLETYVNDLRWHAAPNAMQIEAEQRRYLVQTDDADGVRLLFGLGARLPSGHDNVRAVYRSGIGNVGNVQAGQISVLASRPNGVVGVTNPRRSSGGTDRDDTAQIKRRAPIGLAALDRLVSADDFVDFTLAFAGIGKAHSSYNDNNLVLTIAGEQDAPINTESALFQNLRQVLMRYGDLQLHPDDQQQANPRLLSRGNPPISVSLMLRKALVLAVRARIKLLPDYLWDVVRPQIEAALYAKFGFAAQDIGQPVYAADLIATIQAVRGVSFVDLDVFDTIDLGTPDQPSPPETIAERALAIFSQAQPGSQGGNRVLTPPAAGPNEAGELQAAGIIYLSPSAASTLLLSQFDDEEVPSWL